MTPWRSAVHPLPSLPLLPLPLPLPAVFPPPLRFRRFFPRPLRLLGPAGGGPWLLRPATAFRR